jgi:hypothetical protein
MIPEARRRAHEATRKASERLPGQLIAFSLAAVLAGLPACNLIDVALGRHAKLSKMVPGGNIGSGELECWLTLQFDRYPDGIDRRDVRVRFDSIALAKAQEFDWPYIAKHDQIPRGTEFGSGYRENDRTEPRKDPPLGDPFKVRFPLRARKRIENAPKTIWLTAELFWGGENQNSYRRSLEHVYSSTPNGFF